MARTTYTVGPAPGSSTRWVVQANGRVVSRHNKKKTAMKKVRKLRDRNDTVTVQNRNGQFQKRM